MQLGLGAVILGPNFMAYKQAGVGPQIGLKGKGLVGLGLRPDKNNKIKYANTNKNKVNTRLKT